MLTMRGMCCTDNAVYSIIDTTTLVKPDVSFDATDSQDLSFYSVEKQNHYPRNSSAYTLPLANHLNLPLLI
ncbi:hypothetical protein EH222_00290 [candidate division KSB1 bacterium]|nr:MAG: hypothetical protein EH222_00290 [candidate division KSB1 bacterium]